MSIATFAMAFAAAIQAVLYLGRFGTNARTDGFFVAFALYSTFGVFSQSLRLTSVPLLVEPGARMSMRRFMMTLGIIAVPVLVLTVPLAGLISHLIAPGLGANGRAVTAAALPPLGVAMVLQMWAAGGATVLAIRDRFGAIACAYVSGAGAGLVAFLALMDRTGVQTLGWSMLAMSVLTCGWMMVAVRRSGGLGPRAAGSGRATLARDCGVVLGRTAIYLAFNLLVVVTLAFASRSMAGGTTVLSYSYLFASYLVAGTGMALGMSTIPDMTREARSRDRTLVTATIPRGFRYAMLLIAPALAALPAAGAPLIHALLPGSLSVAQMDAMRVFGLLLVPWTLAALLVNFLLPVMLALGRSRLLGALAVPLVVLHLGATAAGSALLGVDGAVGAFWLAPSCLALVLILRSSGRGRALGLVRRLGIDALRFAGIAAVAFGGSWALAEVLALGTLAQALAGGAIGCVLYASGLWLLARRELHVLVAAIVPRPVPA